MLTMRVETDWLSGGDGVQARAGLHRMVMDEPKAMGGTDLGPNPMQFLLSGLGGCFIGVGRIIAKEKGLDISHIRCRVEGDINPDGMSGKDPSVRSGCLEIRMTVDVDSPESAEKIAEWLDEVEKRCPVRDCVANATQVKVALKK